MNLSELKAQMRAKKAGANTEQKGQDDGKIEKQGNDGTPTGNKGPVNAAPRAPASSYGRAPRSPASPTSPTNPTAAKIFTDATGAARSGSGDEQAESGFAGSGPAIGAATGAAGKAATASAASPANTGRGPAATATAAEAAPPDARKIQTVKPAGPAARKISVGGIRRAPVSPIAGPVVSSGTGEPAKAAISKPKSHIPPVVASKEIAADSPLGNLMATANAPASANSDPAYDEISLQASLAHEEGDGEIYRIEELLEDWLPAEQDRDYDADERQAERVDMIKRAVSRLNEIFTSQLELLKIADAGHPVCVELGQITKLTFLRVSDSPAAWDALGPDDYAIVVRALRVMADKRQSARSEKGSTKKTSEVLEAASQFEEGAFDNINIDFGFGV